MLLSPQQGLNWSCFILTTGIFCALPAQAQLPEPSLELDTVITPSASSLVETVKPRVRTSYNSGGGGYDSFTQVDAFFPLWQTPGKDLWYTHDRLSLDDSGNFDGSLVLGYRRLSNSGNTVRGAYVAIDQRSTDHNTFQQLGFGLEQLGGVDLRLNGYLPIGQTRQVAVDTGLQLQDLYFSQHQLNLVLEHQQIYESAAQGLDFEVGTRLANLGRGELRGHAGMYYYDPAGASGTLGYRVRLTADPHPNLDLGLNFQSDGLFGSQVSFQVGASWGGQRRQSDEASALARLADPVGRNGAIVVDQQVETLFRETLVATNPDTGAAWYFRHVKPGSSTDGQFESPYGTVEEAIATSPTNTNTIIYVQDVNTPTTAVTVPENVRLWSTGPLQQINTREVGQVTLPLSNSGVFPSVVDTIAMSNGSHLAGFTITPPSGNDGVFGDSVQDIIVRENRITTTGDNAAGLRLKNGTGSVSALRNTIATTGNTAHGIAIEQQDATLTNAMITGNTITTQGTSSNGVNHFLRGNNAQITAINVTDNHIQATGHKGIGFSAFADNRSVLRDLTLTGNTITTTGNEASAISAFARNAEISRATVSNNTLTTRGSESNAVSLFAGEQGRLNQATVIGNTIETQGSASNGITTFSLSGSTLTQATLTGNTVTTQGQNSAGILAFAVGCETGQRPAADIVCDGSETILASSRLENAAIANNVVTTNNNDSSGILAFAVKTGRLETATITGNTVTTGGENTGNTNNPYSENSGGILAFATNASTVGTATIANNTVATKGKSSSGLAVFSVSDPTTGYGGSTLTTASVSNNTVTTAGQNAHALSAFATNGSTLATATITGNQLTTTGQQAYGAFSFAANNGVLTAANIAQNTLSTWGKDANGIQIAANNGGEVTTATINNNVNTTHGAGASGITAVAISGTVNDVRILSNTVTTGLSGTNSSLGIDVSAITNQDDPNALNGRVNSASITGNTITTIGTKAHGIQLFASEGVIGNAAIANNTVQTSGQEANGILTLATQAGSTIETTISGNTLAATNTAGEGTNGFLGLATTSGSINTTLSNNTVTQAGTNSFSILSNNSASFCVAEFTNNHSVTAVATDLLLLETSSTHLKFKDFSVANIQTSNSAPNGIANIFTNGNITSTMTCP